MPPGGDHTGCVERRADLPNGHELVVRASRPDDVEGLRQLYEGLSDDDRHLRFFAQYRPKPAFYDKLTHLAEVGGRDIIALVDDEIVGEAGYFPLPDGDAELAVTVARPWRGWLGAYLLDVLVDEAAALGIPNLQAEILLENRAMLALMRHRGYAVLCHDDTSTMRVVIGTATPTPVWPPSHTRPRVLVEALGGSWWAQEAAKAAGVDVVVCPGRRGARVRCPALHGEVCPLADGADAIVCVLTGSTALAPDPAQHRRLHPKAKVFVQPPIPDGDGNVNTLGDSVVLPVPRSVPATKAIALLKQSIPARVSVTDSHGCAERRPGA